MKPTPKGWPRISSAIYYRDPKKALEWLAAAFGFEVRLKVEAPDGTIEHSELVLGEGVIMVGDEAKGTRVPSRRWCKSPLSVDGANTQSMMVYVDDANGHCERARNAGATIVAEPELHDYGDEYWADRGYEAVDFEGHHWYFYERVRGPKE